MAGAREERTVWAAVAALTAFALALRFLGLGWILPAQRDPDDDLIRQVAILRDPTPEKLASLDYRIYPHLIPRIVAALPAPKGAADPASLEQQLEAAAAPNVQLRAVIAALSVLLVPATFLLARPFMPAGAALLASFFASVSLLHLWFSVQGRPHSAEVSFGALAVACAMRLANGGSLALFAAAGASAALALGCLQNGVAVLIPLALALVFRWRSDGFARTWPKALLALALAAAAVPVFYPWVLPPTPEAFVRSERAAAAESLNAMRFTGHLIFLDDFRFAGAGRAVRTLRSYEPWLTLLALLGIAAWLLSRRARAAEPDAAMRRRALLVAASFALPYTALVCAYDMVFERFLVQLVPYLACLAAYAGWRIWVGLGARRAVAVGIAIAFGALPLAAAVRQSWLRTQPDTYRLAARWIGEHADSAADRVEVIPSFDLPLAQRDDALEHNRKLFFSKSGYPWMRWLIDHRGALAVEPRFGLFWIPLHKQFYDDAHRDPAGFLEQLPGRFAVLEVFSPGRNPAVLGKLRNLAVEHYARVARFGPEADPRASDEPLAHQDDYRTDPPDVFWRIFRARALGPVIEIYRLR